MREFRSAAILSLTVSVFLAVLVFPAFADEDTRAHPVCKHCNMNREAFGHSRMLIEYSDGTSAGTCSIHCTALELTENRSKLPCRITVGDHDSKKLIDAMTAFWVIGGSEPGVMTGQAKWAFEKKADAEEFVKRRGGKYATFYEALHAAYEGVYEDVKATLDRLKQRKPGVWHICDEPGR
jgi:hypothetical protein